MTRAARISVPSGQTDSLIAELQKLPGLLSLAVQRTASVTPPGDVVEVHLTSHAMHPLIRLLQAHGLGRGVGISLSTSQPVSLIVQGREESITRDRSEATWEEMETAMAFESNMTVLLMFSVGVLAGLGLLSNALHLVVGAMVIAPGFEPLTRLALGAVTRSDAWRRGLADLAKGYFALLLGAALVGLIAPLLDIPDLHGQSTYLSAGALLSYWTTVSTTSVLVSLFASLAGAMVIITNRSVLTAGVMIALALVPSATIVALAAVHGEFGLAARGLLRWSIDAVAVLTVSAAVFAWKRRAVHKRDMLL